MDLVIYQGHLLGYWGSGTIGKNKIFRVRRGNGYGGSILGKKYQERKDYKIPTNPQTERQQEWRAEFDVAVKDADKLSEEEKKPWRILAYRIPGQTWRTLFIRDKLLKAGPP